MAEDIIGRVGGNLNGNINGTGGREEGLNGSEEVAKDGNNNGGMGMEDDATNGAEEILHGKSLGAGGIENGIRGVEELMFSASDGEGGTADGACGGAEGEEPPIKGDFAGLQHEAITSVFPVGLEFSGFACRNLFTFLFFLNLFLGSLGSKVGASGIMKGGIVNLFSPKSIRIECDIAEIDGGSAASRGLTASRSQ